MSSLIPSRALLAEQNNLATESREELEQQARAEEEVADLQASIRLEKLRIEKEEEALAAQQQNRRERRKYANLLFVLLSIWLAAVLYLVLLAGATFEAFQVGLSPQARAQAFVVFLVFVSAYLVTLLVAELGRKGKPTEAAYHRFAVPVVAASLLLLAALAGQLTVKSFSLSNGVLMSLLATTTTNVIGLVWVVVSYLFPGKVVGKGPQMPPKLPIDEG